MSGDDSTSDAPLAGFLWEPPGTSSASNDLVAEIPASIRSKQKLLRTLAAKLRFPAYFGHNWDALEECLRDLSWLPAGDVQIRHCDLPLSPGSQERRTYLLILRAAAAHWQGSGTRVLMCQFPAELKPEVLSVLGR